MSLLAHLGRLLRPRDTGARPEMTADERDAAARQQQRRMAVAQLQDRQAQLDAILADLCAEAALEREARRGNGHGSVGRA